MEKFKVKIVMGDEKFDLELSLKIGENIFYKEDEILEALKDMIKFYFSSDPKFLYKYIKEDYILEHNID